ncbi:MAG: hypothetical protein Q8N99_01435 [Nanoarchaeota archaeon]|nr:hypothetical protein [Nanoarchaeota archaeon]
MVNEINLSLYLICHHGHWNDFIRDARVIQRVSFEKSVPITYFFSGMQLDKMADARESIHNDLWFDFVGAVQKGHFINPRVGYNDSHKPELGIMPYNHIPLVHPWGERIFGDYFDGILRDQVLWSKGIAEQKYHRTPVSIHPPDGIYAPAAAHCLRNCGLDAVVVSGEFLRDFRHQKGLLYWASGLRHVMRTNDVQVQDSHFSNARDFIYAVEAYGHENNMPFVVVGCDIDEFNGMRGMSLHDGVARLCCIADEAYRKGIKMININAASHWNMYQTGIEHVWPWNNVFAMINGNGDMGFIEEGRNYEISHVVGLIAKRFHEGWDVDEAKHRLWEAADAACRNTWCSSCLSGHYQGNINRARHLLQG